MLNISPENSINPKVSHEQFDSFNKTSLSSANKMLTRWLWGVFITVVVLLFLPWTQNIQSKGQITTLQPGQRPQTIHATIAGRIEKWYVREGELVKKGDTIVYLSEVKAEYFDPKLVERTQQQVMAKNSSIVAYQQQIQALNAQISALRAEWDFKRFQLRNKIEQTLFKIESDSIEWQQAELDYTIAQRQLERSRTLNEQGIKPVTDVEDKSLKLQTTTAKRLSSLNKFNTSKNQLQNARIDLQSIEPEYRQKIAKAEGEIAKAETALFDAQGERDKLTIQASNYEQRQQFYYITAPQDCYITQVETPGIGETVKEGDLIVSIMPEHFELAVALFIAPMNLPLVDTGREVRFIFDGWPAFIFSGWPNQSFGTFYGEVVAIDNTVSINNKYRILVRPEGDWPKELRVGSGAQGILLLSNVPLWYEVWRQLNGFPPDFYKNEDNLPKLKAPIKTVK